MPWQWSPWVPRAERLELGDRAAFGGRPADARSQQPASETARPHPPALPPTRPPLPGRQVLQRTVGLSVYRGDVLQSSAVEVVPQRQYTAGEVALLAAGAGFEVAALTGDFDAGVSLAHEDAHRMVACLRRL